MNFFKGFWQYFIGDEDQQRLVEKRAQNTTQAEPTTTNLHDEQGNGPNEDFFENCEGDEFYRH